jgi:hypothetical protein
MKSRSAGPLSRRSLTPQACINRHLVAQKRRPPTSDHERTVTDRRATRAPCTIVTDSNNRRVDHRHIYPSGAQGNARRDDAVNRTVPWFSPGVRDLRNRGESECHRIARGTCRHAEVSLRRHVVANLLAAPGSTTFERVATG